jgi:hypothetical protein
MKSAFLLVVIALAFIAPALPANSQSHSDEEISQQLDLVGHTHVEDVRFGDIWVHEGFAFLGTYSCGDGVKVFDVTNPSSPQLASTLGTSSKSSHEDVMVIRADTPSFQGNLLAVGLQQCNNKGEHKVQFWDVTDARRPVELGSFDVGEGVRGVHELCLFQRDNRVFALLAVPFSEGRGIGGDFRIIEATDPRNPRQIADWGATTALGSAPTGRGASSFCHSAWVNQEGTMAYLSYWDSGVIMLDISDPARPRFIGQTLYSKGEEGNAHSVWPVGGNLLLVADEDFSTAGVSAAITEPAAIAGSFSATELSFTKPACAAGEITSDVIYVAKGCKSKSYRTAGVRGKIALLDGDGCKIEKKVRLAQDAGAAAVIISNNSPDIDLTGVGDGSITIPAILASQASGDRIKVALAGGLAVRVKIGPDPMLNTWGALRIYDTSDPAKPHQMGTWATPRSRQCPPTSSGWYTVHNPFVVGSTAYLSWYADGVRVIDISDPAHPREIAFYVPSDSHIESGDGVEPQHNLPDASTTAAVWGVHVRDDLVFLSDIDSGLYILRHNKTP